MDRKQLDYRSYLLRLWQSAPRSAWQASLQSTADEKTHFFASFHELWEFLTAEMQTGAANAEGTPPPMPTKDGPGKLRADPDAHSTQAIY